MFKHGFISFRRGFTLFELMLGMTIFAMLLIFTLEAVGNITIARTRSMSRITLIEELYFFSEKLSTQIKEGGIIDYEEYWNRKMIEAANPAPANGTGTASGHYIQPTGFGNYGNGGSVALGPAATNYGNTYYYCRSIPIPLTKVGSEGCVNSILNTQGIDQSGIRQRYGQYKLQFTDYNGNADGDNLIPGDEDEEGNIRGDEDDKDIGDGPTVLTGSTPELYLINTMTHERIYFRWTFKQDPNNPEVCDFTLAGTGCLGNVEILKLKGLDIGLGHSGELIPANPEPFDGNIDTWVCHKDWICNGPVLANNYGTLPTGRDSEWVAMFPDYVNVKRLTFSLFPRKDPWKSWAATDGFVADFVSPFLHPYVRVQMTMGLAWEKRKLINNDDPTISVSTTISLDNSITE